jgi:hypothetical protein
MDKALGEATQALQRWESQINLVLNNAHAVYESRPLQLLADFQGLTRQRAEEAKASVAKILGQALQIQDVVQQARAIHKSIVAFLPQGEKIEKIKALLEGASIPVEESNPAASFDLLAPASTPKITPGALLQQMQSEFAVTKKTVEDLTRNICEKENLAADADTFLATLPSGPKAEELKKQVLAASQALLKDPLGSESAAAAIKRLIQDIKGAEQREKDQAAELLLLTAFATQKLQALETLKKAECEIQRDLIAKVQGASTLSHAALVDRLENWLKSLLDPNQQPAIRLASLRKWKEEAVALEQSIQKQMQADSCKLQTRAELKGRFLALKAKCADLHMGEDPDITLVTANITAALRRPSNLEKANRFLVEFSNLLLAK